MVSQPTYRPEFDVQERTYDFARDLAFGQEGEKFIHQFYLAVIENSAEIKSDRYRNGRMAVETQHNPGKKVNLIGNPNWRDSGLNTTLAKWWIYVYAMNQSFIIVSTERLKQYLRMNTDIFNEFTKRQFAQKSDCPAQGYLLEIEHVSDLMRNPKYDVTA